MTNLLNISGVLPNLHVKTPMSPPRTECGIGALMPWADKLWLVNYVSHKVGSGTGLFEIDDSLTITKRPESVVGTYANRMVHAPSNQLLIGPHLIDAMGTVRTVEGLVSYRLTATAEHLTDPENKVYYVDMEGAFLELDLHTLQVKEIFDLNAELELPAGMKAHYKGGHTAQGRVVVADNTYDNEAGLRGDPDPGGRLAEWDGNTWTILERKPFSEVTGRKNWGEVIFATGWDRASGILKVLAEGEWSTYRLPKATHCFEHSWQHEWPRIREVESERYLMDCQGIFYEMSPVLYQGKVWGIRPISTHLRIIGDYCSFRGMLVLAGNQTTPINDTNLFVGQPQAGLWFGKTDDLWQFGKPKGWGGPWWKTAVKAGDPSEPYLMTGFDKKVLHLANDGDTPVTFRVEVDFMGNGNWNLYEIVGPVEDYSYLTFQDGFSAHWVRVVASNDCIATAQFAYT